MLVSEKITNICNSIGTALTQHNTSTVSLSQRLQVFISESTWRLLVFGVGPAWRLQDIGRKQFCKNSCFGYSWPQHDMWPVPERATGGEGRSKMELSHNVLMKFWMLAQACVMVGSTCVVTLDLNMTGGLFQKERRGGGGGWGGGEIQDGAKPQCADEILNACSSMCDGWINMCAGHV